MFKKPLTKTNPYLKDPAKRRDMFCITVFSSTAIEGVHTAVTRALKPFRISTKPVPHKTSMSVERRK
jgi:hypothetical protein